MGDSMDISGVLTAFGAVFLTNRGEHLWDQQSGVLRKIKDIG